mmetsp:Transcript_49588/g.73892  ORF Transcript_49588/g.73892 Transcript_49588/m.73892 type:complete len:236 (-) Transcript_49588:1071-1778(-)
MERRDVRTKLAVSLSIKLGDGDLGEGDVSLGSKIGESVHWSVLVEESRVGSKILAVGNLAFDAGKVGTPFSTELAFFYDVYPILRLIAELHLVSALFVISKVIWIRLLYGSWRYSTLTYYILSVLSTSFLSLLVSAVLKWLMIGRRTGSDGLKKKPLWVKFSDWACDYHFRTNVNLFFVAAGLSRVLSSVMMLHGLDIDYKSGIAGISSFYPSMINQVEIKRSFISSSVNYWGQD